MRNPFLWNQRLSGIELAQNVPVCPAGAVADGLDEGLILVVVVASRPLAPPRPVRRICDNAVVAPPQQPLDLREVPNPSKLMNKLDHRLLSVAPYPEIGPGAFEYRLREDRKADAADHDWRIAQSSYAPDRPLQLADEPVAARPHAVIGIAQCDADKLATAASEILLDRLIRIGHRTKIEQLDLDPRLRGRARHVLQPK